MHKKLTLMVALVLILASCGGGADAGTATTDGEGTTAAQAETTATTAQAATTQSMDDGDSDDEGTHDEEGEDHDAVEQDDDHSAGLEITEDGVTADQVFEVTLSEFAFAPNPLSLNKGEVVSFVLKNEGSIQHEFRVTSHERIESHLATGHDDHAAEPVVGEPMLVDGDLLVLVDPGQEVTVTVKILADADYDRVACLLPGHFEAGMEAELELES